MLYNAYNAVLFVDSIVFYGWISLENKIPSIITLSRFLLISNSRQRLHLIRNVIRDRGFISPLIESETRTTHRLTSASETRIHCNVRRRRRCHRRHRRLPTAILYMFEIARSTVREWSASNRTLEEKCD